MASCLLECLCEADLERYYPHFVAVGLQKVEELASVTMKDYSRLGVHNMEDRKRLFQLIKIIQSVCGEDEDDKTPIQPGCVYLQPQSSRWATRRQLHFDVYDQESSTFSSSPDISYPQPRKCLAEAVVKAAPRLPTMVAEEGPNSATMGPSCKGLRGLALGSRDSEGPVIHRVMHVTGYNYGVPQTCIRYDFLSHYWPDCGTIQYLHHHCSLLYTVLL